MLTVLFILLSVLFLEVERFGVAMAAEDGTTPATDVRAENFFRAKAANGDLYFPSAERFLDNRPWGRTLDFR